MSEKKNAKFVPVAVGVRNYVSDHGWSPETEGMIWEQYEKFAGEEIVYKTISWWNLLSEKERDEQVVYSDWQVAARYATLRCQNIKFESCHTPYPAVLRLDYDENADEYRAFSISYFFMPAHIGVFEWTVNRL